MLWIGIYTLDSDRASEHRIMYQHSCKNMHNRQARDKFRTLWGIFKIDDYFKEKQRNTII